MNFFDFIKTNKFIILSISIIMNLVLLITSGILLYQNFNYECICDKEETICENTIEQEENAKFYVEVKGAVKTPGVYEATSDNIINDIIKLAGGFTKSAYTNNINLSRKVTAELVIYVYTKTEYKQNNQNAKDTTCNCATYDITNCTDNNLSEIVASDSSDYSASNNTTSSSDKNVTSSNTNEKININTASKEELVTLNGIGDAKANDIINYRNSNGKFNSIEDLKNVSGIGDALFAKIKDYITV